MSVQISKEKAMQAYEKFQSVPASNWDEAKAEDLLEELDEEWPLDDEQRDSLQPESLSVGLRVLGKVAHEYDQETFTEAAIDGEIPPLELSEQEMQFVRGGALATLGACAAVAGLFGTGIAIGEAMDG